jgi:hypothetical protein
MKYKNFCLDTLKTFNWQKAVKDGLQLNVPNDAKDKECGEYGDPLTPASIGVSEAFLRLYREENPKLHEDDKTALQTKMNHVNKVVQALAISINTLIANNKTLRKQKHQPTYAQQQLNAQLCMKVSESALKASISAMAFNTLFVQHQQKYIEANTIREQEQTERDEKLRKKSGLKTQHENFVEVYKAFEFLTLNPRKNPRALGVLPAKKKC